MKVIHWELRKKLKFDHKKKWYMPNPESVEENEKHKILKGFETQTDHLISTRRPDLVIINKTEKRKKKRNLSNNELCRPGGSQSENKRKQKERPLIRPCQRTKIVMEHEGDGDTSSNWCVRNSVTKLGKGLEELEIRERAETIQLQHC